MVVVNFCGDDRLFIESTDIERVAVIGGFLASSSLYGVNRPVGK